MGIVSIILNPAFDLTVTIDKIQLGTLNRCNSEILDVAGKGVNVAYYIRQIAQKVTITGILGSENSSAFHDFFNKNGIVDKCILTSGRIRTNFKIFDNQTHQTTDINTNGNIDSVAVFPQFLEKLKLLCRDQKNTLFVFSGSLPRNLPQDTYYQLIKMVHSYNKKTYLDTSGLPLKLSLEAKPYFIKPNLTEFYQLLDLEVPKEENVDNVMDDILKNAETVMQNVENILLSFGANGSLYISKKHGAYRVYPLKVQVKSTVGAGDALVAGMVVGSSRGLTLEDNLKMSNALSVATVTQFGIKLPSRDVINRYQSMMRVEKIN